MGVARNSERGGEARTPKIFRFFAQFLRRKAPRKFFWLFSDKNAAAGEIFQKIELKMARIEPFFFIVNFKVKVF